MITRKRNEVHVQTTEGAFRCSLTCMWGVRMRTQTHFYSICKCFQPDMNLKCVMHTARAHTGIAPSYRGCIEITCVSSAHVLQAVCEVIIVR